MCSVALAHAYARVPTSLQLGHMVLSANKQTFMMYSSEPEVGSLTYSLFRSGTREEDFLRQSGHCIRIHEPPGSEFHELTEVSSVYTPD